MQRWNNDVMETTNKNNVEQYEEQEKNKSGRNDDRCTMYMVRYRNGI